MKTKSIWVPVWALATALVLSFPVLSSGMQASQTKPAAAKTTAANSTPTAAEIADAKAKGLVWVNLSTKVYHKDDSHYGTTKHGEFMSEADAIKAGYHLAKPSAAATKKTTAPAPKN